MALWPHPVPPTKLDNGIIRISCDIIKKVHGKVVINKTLLATCSIWHNAAFKAVLNPLQRHNITKISHIVENGEILSFEELRKQFNLSTSAFCQYNQLNSVSSGLLLE